jgi:hypothetical protein
VTTSKAFHKQAEISRVAAWVDNQVNVIRHKAIGMDFHAEFLAEFAKRREICRPIALREKDDLTIVAALDDMMWVAGSNDSAVSRHPCLSIESTTQFGLSLGETEID